MLYAPIPCAGCGKRFRPRTYNHVRCKPCRAAHKIELNRKRGNAFYYRRGRIKLGTILNCSICGGEYALSAGPQRRCPSCQDSHTHQKAGKSREWMLRNGLTPGRYERSTEQRKSKNLALERDNYKCRKCGAGEDGILHVHHIDGAGKGTPKSERNDSLENLITLCNFCHRELHAITERALYRAHPETVQGVFHQYVGGHGAVAKF